MVETCRLHIVVEGHVQGVGFRFAARSQARQLGLTGWVRNLPDGERVEAIAEGPRDKLLAFLEWCGRGPALARVTRVVPNFDKASGLFGEFEVRF